jgi:hypothetical protein
MDDESTFRVVVVIVVEVVVIVADVVVRPQAWVDLFETN